MFASVVLLLAILAVVAESAKRRDNISSLCSQYGADSALLSLSDSYIVLSNGYVCAVLNSQSGAVQQLRGDYTGKYNYGHNSLASTGIALESQNVVINTRKYYSVQQY